MAITIVPKYFGASEVTQIDVALIRKTLTGYPAPQKVYYRLYDGLGSKVSEGNLFVEYPNSEALLAALEAAVGPVDWAVLAYNTLYSNTYTFSYRQGELRKTIELTGSFIASGEYDQMKTDVFTQLEIEEPAPPPPPPPPPVTQWYINDYWTVEELN
jgi:hypothetical protein